MDKRIKIGILSLLGVGSAVVFGQTVPFGSADVQGKAFTDNLELIEYQDIGTKNLKGIWEPTEDEYKEVYKYVHGEDMVNWQLPDGTPMCLDRDGKQYNCVPHWKQEFENAKIRGEIQEGVRENMINGDKLLRGDVRLTKAKNSFDLLALFKGLILTAIGAVEFEDHFTEASANPCLDDHTPDTTGTGWTVNQTTEVLNCLLILASTDDLGPADAFTNEGELNETDDVMSSPDVIVQIDTVNGDTNDDTNHICCRMQDADNMYCVLFNESSSDLYENTAGTWATIDTSGGGIADGSTVELICNGSTISVEDDGAEILTATDTTISVAGKSGIGMGNIIISTHDMSGQVVDDFISTVTAAAPVTGAKKQSVIWFD